MSEAVSARPYHALSVIPDIDQRIIASLSGGKSIYALADELGVDRMAVSRRAWKHPDYADAVGTNVAARMELREEQLNSAMDNVSVTRANHLLNHARWLAERSCPERWGQKGQAGGTVAVQVVIQRMDHDTVTVST